MYYLFFDISMFSYSHDSLFLCLTGYNDVSSPLHNKCYHQLLIALAMKGIYCVFFISTCYGFEGCSHALYSLLPSKPDKFYFSHFSLGCSFLTSLILFPLNSLQLLYHFQLKPCKHHYLFYLSIALKDICYI